MGGGFAAGGSAPPRGPRPPPDVPARAVAPALAPAPAPAPAAGGGGSFSTLRELLLAKGVAEANIAILEEQAVDLELVKELEDGDLREFGVAQWGERKKIIAAAKMLP